jgi:hypothetical protein
MFCEVERVKRRGYFYGMAQQSTELDELEAELLRAADTWFNAPLHGKLLRLIAIARKGESAERARLEIDYPIRRVVEQSVMAD